MKNFWSNAGSHSPQQGKRFGLCPRSAPLLAARSFESFEPRGATRRQANGGESRAGFGFLTGSSLRRAPYFRKVLNDDYQLANNDRSARR